MGRDLGTDSPAKDLAPLVSRVLAFRWELVTPPLFALAIVSNLLLRSFASPWLGIGWMALGLGFMLSKKHIGPKPVFYGLIAILVFHALAIPGSLVWGSGNWVLTTGVIIWMAPSILIYVADVGPAVFTWLIPAWLIHTALVLYQGLTNWRLVDGMIIKSGDPVGLSHNPNLAAGFLVIGIVYILTTRFKWLAPPMLLALLFTGSRWGLIVCAVVVIAMLVTRRIDWKPLVATAVIGFLFLFVFSRLTPLAYNLAGYESMGAAASGVTADIGTRLAIPHIPSFLPQGVAEHSGLHNVGVRMAYENGILAALLWVGISIWALTRHRNGVAWWMLLTVLLIGQLDYYVFQGHLGSFWWLLLGMLVKKHSHPAIHRGDSTMPTQ